MRILNAPRLPISGTHVAVPVHAWSCDEILVHAWTDMSQAEDVLADEVLDITATGTCLIETPDRMRHVVRITEGRIQGPLRVMQIRDMSEREIRGAQREQRNHVILRNVNILLSLVLAIASFNLAHLLFESPRAPAFLPPALFLFGLFPLWLAAHLLRAARIGNPCLLVEMPEPQSRRTLLERPEIMALKDHALRILQVVSRDFLPMRLRRPLKRMHLEMIVLADTLCFAWKRGNIRLPSLRKSIA